MRIITFWIVLSTICMVLTSCKENATKQEDPPMITSDSSEKKSEQVVAEPIEVINLTDQVSLFVVVAGAYSSETGAYNKSVELKKLGFVNAGVIQRPGSRLYSALVERFDNQQDAEAFADQLKTDSEIKSYVYKVK